MKTITYKLKDLDQKEKKVTLKLGYVGENEHVQIRIDCAEIWKDYPAAVASLAVEPPEGSKYPAIVTRDGDMVCWTVKDSDLANDGYGRIQLTFTEGSEIQKTVICRTRVDESIIGSGTAPDPIADFVAEANEALAELEAAEVHGPVIGEDGYWYTWSKDAGEYVKTDTKAQGEDGQQGPAGKDGADGAPGQDGHTPVKGTDYWTQQDQADIVAAAALETVSAVIDDTAGDGDTNKTWSADKIAETTGQLLNDIQGLESGYKTIPYTLSSGFISDVNGQIIPSGINNERYTENYIEVIPGQQIVYSLEYADLSKTCWFAYATYDNSKNFVSRITVDSTTAGGCNGILNIPVNATYKYIRFTFRTYTGAEFNAKSQIEYVKEINADIEEIKTATGLNDAFVPYYGEIVSYDTDNIINAYPTIYTANEIDFKKGDSNYCGIEFFLKRFSIGSTITVESHRDKGNSWHIRIDLLDKNGQRIGSETVTTDNKLSRIIESETATVKVTLASNWNTSIETGTIIKFTDIKIYYSDIEEFAENGNKVYTGERISISNNSDEKHKCTVSLWKQYTSENIPLGMDTEKVFYKNQSMTIYGGYVFFFSENGGGAVADYSTKEMLAEFDSLPTTLQHANSAQFSDIFYDQNDEFPLLFISRCGNASYQSGEHDYDELIVYRVQRNNNEFTFTTVNSIRLNVQTYGLSWGIDNVTHILYAQGPVNGNWQVPEGNHIDFWTFNEPDKTSILSGTEIVLQHSDAKSYTRMDYATIQGCTVDYGKLFQGITASTQYVWVIDSVSGKVLSKVPILSDIEIEGVAIYNGKLYTSHKNQNNLYVYEVVFP